MNKFLENTDYTLNISVARKENLIGHKIHMERRLHKMSLVQLREKLFEVGVDISTAAISKWETGETVPNSYQLLALSIIYGKDSVLSCLFGLENLNFAGRQKVHEYREDLIATGKYKPAYEDSHG